jgi:TldD protein
MLLSCLIEASFAADVITDALVAELDRTMAAWKGQPDGPYFLGYRVTELRSQEFSATGGAVDTDTHSTQRYLIVEARVGTPDADSTHRVRDDGFGFRFDQPPGGAVPLDDDPLALRAAVWSATDRAVTQARDAWLRVEANRAVKVKETDSSADFGAAPPVVHEGPIARLALDMDAWRPVVRDLSRSVDADSHVRTSDVTLEGTVRTTWMVNSEGTRIRESQPWIRLALQADAVADDGMDVMLYRWKDVRDPATLPTVTELKGWADSLREDVLRLRAAPLADPYTGPVLLRGRAAGVFVHEVLGHRSEGQRQKDEDEGATFRDLVGQRVLPETISIIDDPTLGTYGGEDLNGFYAYDEEGVAAEKAVLVDKGTYHGFLMSRSPIHGFDRSNGHGRADDSDRPVARMANTILQTSAPVPKDKLRQMLIDEAKRQGRPFGLLIDELSGGFTMTGRIEPNAFNIRAETVWRVYVDGRPDELVRGLDLIGTPLVALSKVIAAGDDPGVFNGWCGAESGFIPNAAVSPSLLIGQLEVQRKEKEQDRPPLLPRPEAGVTP